MNDLKEKFLEYKNELGLNFLNLQSNPRLYFTADNESYKNLILTGKPSWNFLTRQPYFIIVKPFGTDEKNKIYLSVSIKTRYMESGSGYWTFSMDDEEAKERIFKQIRNVMLHIKKEHIYQRINKMESDFM